MKKGKYVDGFVIPVPRKNTAKYAKMEMPFDMKRFAYAGFKVMVGA